MQDAGAEQVEAGPAEHLPFQHLDPVELALDGARETSSDLAVLRDQAGLFGPVASDPTAWQLLSDVDGMMLDRLRDARAPGAGTCLGATV